MELWSNFLQTWWIGMVKSGSKKRVCCPVGFSEELIEVFKLNKNLKLAPNLTKKPKTFQSSQFLYNFCQISKRLRGLE